MSTSSLTIGTTVTRAHGRVVLVGAASLLLFIVVLVGGIAGWPSGSGSFAPSSVAVADIPSNYLVLYQQSAARFGIDWAVLAGIGKLECDHGRSQARGCDPSGTVNGSGATGPMQFLGSTWRAGTPIYVGAGRRSAYR